MRAIGAAPAIISRRICLLRAPDPTHLHLSMAIQLYPPADDRTTLRKRHTDLHKTATVQQRVIASHQTGTMPQNNLHKTPRKPLSSFTSAISAIRRALTTEWGLLPTMEEISTIVGGERARYKKTVPREFRAEAST